MKKITYSATSYPFDYFVKKTLRTGLVISFMFTAVQAHAITENSYHTQTPTEVENVITMPSVGTAVQTKSVDYMTEVAFQNTVKLPAPRSFAASIMFSFILIMAVNKGSII